MDDVPQALEEMFASARSADGFVGLGEQAARDRAISEGADRVRVFRVGTHMAGHADGRSGRLNLVVRDGTVILASYF